MWSAVSTRKALVTNAASFSSTAKQVYNADVVELYSEEIHERNIVLNLDEVFNNAPAVKGIESVHYMKTRNSSVLTYANKVNQCCN